MVQILVEDSHRQPTTATACQACKEFTERRKSEAYYGPLLNRHTCKNGDTDLEPSALESLEQENNYWRELYREARRLVRGVRSEDQPDTQQVLAAKLHRYRRAIESRTGKEKKGYLGSIAKSARVDVWGKNGKCQQTEKTYADQFLSCHQRNDDDEEYIFITSSAEDEAASKLDFARALEKTLSPQEGRILRLVELKGNSIAAAAEELKITESAAYKIHARMLKKLWRFYKDNDNDRQPTRRRR